MAEDDDTQQSPFARPGFIVGAVVVAALIVAGIFLTVLNLNRADDAAPPADNPWSSSTVSAAPARAHRPPRAALARVGWAVSSCPAR